MRLRGLLLLAGLCCAVPELAQAAAPDAPVTVRAESRAGFGRVSFFLPGRVRFRITREDDHVLVEFADPRVVIGSPDSLPRNVTAATGGAGRAEITVAAGAQIRPGRIDNRVVIDILDPAPGAAAEAAKPAASTPQAEEKPLPQAAAATAAADKAEPAPSPPPLTATPPETAASAPAVTPGPNASPVSIGVRLLHPAPGHGRWAFLAPFEPTVGAAAFRRGGSVLVVFDDRRPLDLAALRGEAALSSASVQLLPASTVLRLPLPEKEGVALSRRPEGWVIASAGGEPPEKPIRIGSAEHRLLFSAAGSGQVVTIADPDTGANILVGTQRDAGQGVAALRRSPEFAVLPTWQGVAIDPISDRLVLTALQEGFALSATPGELALPSQPDAAENMADAHALTRRFDFPALPESELLARLQAQINEAGEAAPLARGPKRRAAAQTMIALGMGAEAESLLGLAAVDDAREAQNPDSQALLGIAALLAGRPGDAEAIGDARLAGTDEITFWRAVRSALAEEASPAAATIFAATAKLALAYPAPLRSRLLPLVAETLAAGGEPAAAGLLLAQAPNDPSLALARAMALEAGHEVDPALAAYDALGEARDRLVRVRAGSRAVELRLATRRIDAGKAADALERLAFSWRGDQRELALRLRAAALRAEAGAWRPALASLRQTEAAFPDQQSAIRERLRGTFGALLEGGNADRLAPLDLVALVAENADLVPDGPAGAALAARLAEKLVALDLPQRAAPVLEKLLAGSSPGSARAQIGARLAELRLQENDAGGCLAALSASEADGLPPALAEQRTLAFARASAARGDHAGALAALAALGTPAGDEARAELLEAAKDWPAAERALADLVDKAVPSEGKLQDEQQRLVLRLASAAAEAGDEERLTSLRGAMTPRMGSGPVADMFRLLTGGRVRGVADLPQARQDIALARMLPNELQSLRPR